MGKTRSLITNRGAHHEAREDMKARRVVLLLIPSGISAFKCQLGFFSHTHARLLRAEKWDMWNVPQTSRKVPRVLHYCSVIIWYDLLMEMEIVHMALDGFFIELDIKCAFPSPPPHSAARLDSTSDVSSTHHVSLPITSFFSFFPFLCKFILRKQSTVISFYEWSDDEFVRSWIFMWVGKFTTLCLHKNVLSWEFSCWF